MIKIAAAFIAVYGLIGTFTSYLYSTPAMALSVFMGSFSMLFNLLAIAFFWHFVFRKKLIALALVVIIFKYLILVTVLLVLAKSKHLVPVGFVIGMGALIFCAVGTVIFKALAREDSRL